MPNWCYNHLMFLPKQKADAVGLGKLKEFFGGDFSFDKIVPKPEDETDWYRRNIANWGTKWDVGGEDIEIEIEELFNPYCEDESFTDVAVVEFSTAWSPPIPVIDKLAEMFPDFIIVHSFEEAGMCYKGERVYEHGRLIEEKYREYDDMMVEERMTLRGG